MGSQDNVIANIRRILNKKDWSGNRLADFAGLSRGYVADILAGRSSRSKDIPHRMTLETLDKIAEALEVSPIRLMEDPPD